jgi:mRNA interferase MazF
MRRGEIRWYTFAPPDKRRPVLVLTRNSAVGLMNSLTVAPITSTMRGIPSEVFVGPAEGLATECAVNLDHLQTVPKANLGALIGALSPDRMIEVQRAVAFALGFDSWLFG